MTKEKEFYKNLQPYLNCIDYTVSKESYEVMHNEEYDMLVTSPLPVNLDKYYKSEEYISHTDGSKNMFEKTYQLVKSYTLNKKLKLINSLKTDSRTVLDIGAGTGDFLKTCKENKWTTFGVEPSIDARNIAKVKKIDLVENLESLGDKKFDIITLWHVLEHIPNLKQYINKIKELLKPNGYLIIAVPNYKSFDAKYYKEFWAAYDVPRHVWHFSKTSIKKIFKEFKMEVIKILPMKFDSYYVSLLSEKYKKGKMNYLNAIYIGMKSNIKAKKSLEHSSLIYLIKND